MRGGGLVVAPWSKRESSLVNPRFKAVSPSVESSGSIPVRHTLRQLSMIVSPGLKRLVVSLFCVSNSLEVLYSKYTGVHVCLQAVLALL
jgi:hypothetical protein